MNENYKDESCCSEKPAENYQKISFKNDCCQTKTAAEPIKENFVSSEFSLKKTETISLIDADFLSLYESKINFSNQSFIDSSPPKVYLTFIYIYNSTFLI